MPKPMKGPVWMTANIKAATYHENVRDRTKPVDFTCHFPGCCVQSEGRNSEWLFLEAPSLSYDHYAFCPEHGEALKAKHDEIELGHG